MNGHGAFAVTSLFFVMITALVGFAAHNGGKLEASQHYIARIETMDEERQQLTRQVAELKESKEVKETKEIAEQNPAHVREVTVTAYSPTVEECGPDPMTTASMVKVRPGIVAVSRDLFDQGWVFGKKVYVKGHGIYEIADLMNKRHTQRVDIFIPDTEKAREFGVKQVKVALLAG